MGSAEIERRCAGVALFGKSQEADLAAFKWAYKHLSVSKNYKLRIIHVNEPKKANETQHRVQYNHKDELETKFKKSFPPDEIGKIQSEIRKIKEYIGGVTYEGENIEATLQDAVNSLQESEGLDTLVLGWPVTDDTKGPPVTINGLESEKCSIVLAKVDSRTKLTFSMPPATQTSVPAEGDTAVPPANTAEIGKSTATPSVMSKKKKKDVKKKKTATPSEAETEALPPLPSTGSASGHDDSAQPSSREKTKIR